MEKSLSQIIKARKKTFDKRQVDLISKAYAFAKEAHKSQKRKSGEPYFNHCVETAKILSSMGMGSATISAGLLHDVPEDTDFSIEMVRKDFGKDIAFIVEGVTKLSNIRLKGSVEEYYLDNLRKMFMAMAADIRVIIIKLADRLHNMRTLDSLPKNKRDRIAQETMEVFVPIANRFGIGEIKGELEDLAFKYLDPENYEYVVKLETEAFQERSALVSRAIKEIGRDLKKEGIKPIDVHGRAKHYYRLYQKLRKHDMNIDKIYDMIAIRLILPTVADCYEALGIVHKKYRPLVGRIKDYISLPKPNGYKSIHTTVFGPEGKIVEIQIRTERMHKESEFGIAAHWVYSDKKSWKEIFLRKRLSKVPEKELRWVDQLRSWQEETGGQGDDFWGSLKIDFFKNHIFAFTPSGDVIELPEGATPVDFAYKIHSEIGDKLGGAKINGKLVSLNYSIKNGDLVDIIISRDRKVPNRDWLSFVKTAHAKSRIKNSLRKSGIDIL